jgi:hypothetical protein
MKPLLIAAALVLVPAAVPTAALAQVAAGSLPNSFDSPAQPARVAAAGIPVQPSTPAGAAIPAPTAPANPRAEAVLRELKRGGQVYFLHNEVETIANRKAALDQLLPEARIGVAHGQMHERDLEKVMRDFAPHIVFSGINHGQNTADDVTYSGTIAAAIEATLLGIPAVAFSQDFDEIGHGKVDFSLARETLRRKDVDVAAPSGDL